MKFCRLSFHSLLIALGLTLPAHSSLAEVVPSSAVSQEVAGTIAQAESPSPEAETASEDPESEPSRAEFARRQVLIEADRLYQAGEVEAAIKLYRSAKAPFPTEAEVNFSQTPIYDLEQLSPAAAVYWRIAQEGLEQQLESKIFAPLQLLVEQYPEFIPGHLLYAQALEDYERTDQALQVLTQAATRYPGEPKLLRAAITAYEENEQWLQASMLARQFALLNPEHPEAEAFSQIADEQLEHHRQFLRSELRGNAIANIITGALGFAVTGNLLGPLSALETTATLLQGESGIGDRIARQVQEDLPMVEDEAVLAYVREIGHELTRYTGRDEFEYEFYVVMDDSLNAFALPGGKIFVHAGAIAKTDSEAELAGLLAHELAHAVLSHGFQLVMEGNLTANATQFFPYGGMAANLFVLDYSRDMERQADRLGTQILAASGYAADGLYNLMLALAEESEQSDRPRPPAWLSTHPDTAERIRNLEALILENGYNRYAYEGVARHDEIKQKVARLIEEYKAEQEQAEQEPAAEETEELQDFIYPIW